MTGSSPPSTPRRSVWLRALVGLFLASACRAGAADEHSPVAALADARLEVTTPAGHGKLALYVSPNWGQAHPEIHRAIIVFHGVLRNADVYLRSAREAVDAAGSAGQDTLLVVPQFLNEVDARAWSLEGDMLRWQGESWEGGADALAPAPISAYSAIDAILARLADRATLPGLREVVLVGHSGGGQVVARYAVVGRGEEALIAAGIRVRYVIANPSSYLYFSPERPVLTSEASCPGYNNWKYGWNQAPSYAANGSPEMLESAFMARDVIFLLGSADTDPAHPALDRSCAAEAQGPYRLARGLSYVRYLNARHPQGVSHRLYIVPGVGHDGARMLGSSCGRAALFDTPGCDSTPLAP